MGVAVVVIVLAVVFYFANVPDIKTEDDYHLDDSDAGASHSIWTHPHFVLAVAAQFFYVAAQAGIFSFFINYMTAEAPAHSRRRGNAAMTGLSGACRLAAQLAARLVRDRTKPAFWPSATRAPPTWRRWALSVSWSAASPAPVC